MRTLGALVYADLRSFVNQLHEIRRSPSRAIMWTLFALFLAALIVLRILSAARSVRHRPALAASTLELDLMVCVALLATAVALFVGERLAGLFAHPAEARFIIDSPATPFVATLYVQARQIARGALRQGIGLLYIALVYLPRTLPAAGLVRDIVMIGCACAFIAAIPLARQLMPQRLLPLVILAGLACGGVALIVLVRDGALALATVLPAARGFAAALPAWHPGTIFVAPAPRATFAIAALLASTAALFLYVALVARDAYPELYELSMRRLARTEGLRRRPFAWTRTAPALPVRSSAASSGAPGGVAIFVWRAWTEYRRTNTARSTAAETAIMLAGGYGLALLTRVLDVDLLIAFASPLVNIVFIIAVMRSAMLATELRRPLFWLSGATLFERLCALGLAQAWRVIGWFVLIGIGLSAGRAALPLDVAALVVAPCAALLAGAIGYASYALFPSEADQRGPLVFFRLLLAYVLIVPPLAAGLATAFFARAATGAILAAGAVTLAEAAVLAGFAAWRLDRMSIALR